MSASLGSGLFVPIRALPRDPRLKMNWSLVAEKLAAAIPVTALHPAVRRWLDAPENRSARLAIALSGGADSVALLLLLWAHWPERRGRLLALHFNHRLRGRASAGDARFCTALCRGLGVGLVVGEWTERPIGEVTEGVARAARQAFFNAQLGRRRIGVLCTGHHRDDLAETFFMRLARGAGTVGLAAPRPVHVQVALSRVVLRPLLNLDKAGLIGDLRVAGGHWREDASNTSGIHLRNRVRSALVPVWREVAAEPGRDALAGLALSRELLQEDDDALEFWVDRVTRIDAGGGLALPPLAGLPRAVLRRAVRRWLESTPARTDINRKGFNALVDLVASGRAGARHSLGAGHFARRGRARLTCEPV